MAELTIIEAIRAAIQGEMERDERVMVLGLDVGRLGGVFRTTDGMIEKFGRSRVFDTPLAEASIVGSAIGLAISGMIPVAEIQFLGFTHQAFHQMGDQLGRFRYRSRGRYPLPITVRAPMGGGTKTPEFHPDAIEAQFVQFDSSTKIAMTKTTVAAKSSSCRSPIDIETSSVEFVTDGTAAGFDARLLPGLLPTPLRWPGRGR